MEKRSASSASSANYAKYTPGATPVGLTEGQRKRIEELMRRNYSAWAARTEVLAPDHEIGCECEVCG